MSGEALPNDLRQMLGFLCDHDVPKAVFRARRNQSAPTSPTRLAAVYSVRQSSLQGWYANGMPDDRVDRLAEWYQFTPQARVLFKKGARTTGQHQSFKTAYLTHWEPKVAAGDLPTNESQTTADPVLPRRHDPTVRLVVEQIVRAARQAGVDDHRPNLASLSLFLQQAGPGESIPVSVELVCQPEPIGGFEIAVYRGRLEITPGAATIDQEAPPLASDAPHPLTRSDRTLTLQRANASSNDGRVAWTVSSDKGPIGVLRLDDDAQLCRIAEPAEGDTITAVFHAYVKDLDLSDPDPDDDAEDVDRLYSFLRPDGKRLSPTKRQLIKRAILREELGPAPNGWHAIAEDRRRLALDDK